MSDFVEVKTAELVGSALDWAVAMADGWKADRPQDGQVRKNGVYRLVGSRQERSPLSPDWHYAPSTDWSHGGPQRDKYKVDITELDTGVLASICTESCECIDGSGPTALIAICRAIVTLKLGDAVQIPAELANNSNNNDNT